MAAARPGLRRRWRRRPPAGGPRPRPGRPGRARPSSRTEPGSGRACRSRGLVHDGRPRPDCLRRPARTTRGIEEQSMSDIASVVVFVALLALVTVVCVVLSRRLGGHARSDDPAASLHEQRQAQARRDVHEQPGTPCLGPDARRQPPSRCAYRSAQRPRAWRTRPSARGGARAAGVVAPAGHRCCPTRRGACCRRRAPRCGRCPARCRRSCSPRPSSGPVSDRTSRTARPPRTAIRGSPRAPPPTSAPGRAPRTWRGRACAARSPAVAARSRSGHDAPARARPSSRRGSAPEHRSTRARACRAPRYPRRVRSKVRRMRAQASSADGSW